MLDASPNSPSSVGVSFTPTSSTFTLSVGGGSSGFSGSVTHHLPFAYRDYVSGLVKIMPTPSSVREGSVIATWDDVSIKPGEYFNVSVKVSKQLNSTLLKSFEKPKLVAKAAYATPYPPLATPVVEQATPAPTVVAIEKAEGTNWLVYLVVVAVIAGLAWVFMAKKKKKPGL